MADPAAAAAAAEAASSLPPATSAPAAVAAAQQPAAGSAATASGLSVAHARAPAEQLQMPYMQPSYVLYPQARQHIQLAGYPVALQALGAVQVQQAPGSPLVGTSAAQLMAAEVQAVTVSCGYTAAALLSSQHALMQAGHVPSTDCPGLMQPALLYASALSNQGATNGPPDNMVTSSKLNPATAAAAAGTTAAAPDGAQHMAKAATNVSGKSDQAAQQPSSS